jgi:hypothetical protein
MANDDDSLKYEVGYRRPPAASRFRKGQSGNPKGRPKGSRNFKTEFQQELKKAIDVTENGRRKRIRKSEGVVKQVVNKSLSGDPKMIAILLNEVRLHEAASLPAAEVLGRPEDKAVMANIVQRIRESLSQGPPEQTNGEQASDPNSTNPKAEE